jgi:hypothetical protein
VATTENTQFNKVHAIYEDFKKAFSEAVKKGNGMDALRARVNAVDQARASSLIIRPDITDPAALNFLTRLTDGLQKYSDQGHAYISSLEDADKLLASITEAKTNLSIVPSKEHDQAVSRIDSLTKQYNDLYQGPLPKQRDELETLGKELIALK